MYLFVVYLYSYIYLLLRLKKLLPIIRFSNNVVIYLFIYVLINIINDR